MGSTIDSTAATPQSYDQITDHHLNRDTAATGAGAHGYPRHEERKLEKEQRAHDKALTEERKHEKAIEKEERYREKELAKEEKKKLARCWQILTAGSLKVSTPLI